MWFHHDHSTEAIREQLVAGTDASTDLRGWVQCLVRPLTDHLAELGNPTWYARFAAQAMTDPAYHGIVVKDALSSASLVQVIDGINRCLPDLPAAVTYERNIMARNLLMHSCADRERAQTAAKPEHAALRLPHLRPWAAVGAGLIDAIVGLWTAPVTPDGDPA